MQMALFGWLVIWYILKEALHVYKVSRYQIHNFFEIDTTIIQFQHGGTEHVTGGRKSIMLPSHCKLCV